MLRVTRCKITYVNLNSWTASPGQRAGQWRRPLGCLSRNLMKKNMITIGFLADHFDTIPTLAKWFRNQWPDYYADWSEAAMIQDFLEDTSRNSLPTRLVAFESNELVGTIILREDETETSPEHQPELGGLYVVESHRGHGVGTELVRAGMKIAREQGYATVSATTVAAAGILERLGWEFVKTVIYPDGQVSLYRCTL